MRFAFFYHSVISDWNHGNAHFLRGIAGELMNRGHEVRIFEPLYGWSALQLLNDQGQAPFDEFYSTYPNLKIFRYQLDSLDLDEALEGADIVLAHEWNDPALIAQLGAYRAIHPNLRLFFHDTHHRTITQSEEMKRYDLRFYDGALVFGESLKEVYLARELSQRAWTWHEAADVQLFKPLEGEEKEGDLIWIGNWGDEERSAELQEYLMLPAHELGLKGSIFGVRYPNQAKQMLADSGLNYRGWIANFKVPELFARFKVTVHIPRRPYLSALKGIPTIRIFEALACGIPLICANWEDTEGLFAVGRDFLIAKNRAEMTHHLRAMTSDPSIAKETASHGLATIRKRHTCSHRIDELSNICRQLGITQEF